MVDRIKSCLVLGSATTLWDDIEKATNLGEYDAVYAAKHAGIYWPGKLDVWATFHPDWMEDFKKQRAAQGYSPALETVSHLPNPQITRVVKDYLLPGMPNSGASGFFAVALALKDGYNRVVLCGIPMTRNTGRIDGRVVWESAVTYQTRVLPALSGIKDRVRSMSGWTREKLGSPTSEWLLGHSDHAGSVTSGKDANGS